METFFRIRCSFALSAPQRCNAQRSDAQRKFFTTLSISLFLQRHRCDALPCFSASPVEIFYIAHIALRPLLPFFLSPQWFTVQNNKKFAKNYNAAMSPLATRDGQRNAQRTTQRCGALRLELPTINTEVDRQQQGVKKQPNNLFGAGLYGMLKSPPLVLGQACFTALKFWKTHF